MAPFLPLIQRVSGSRVLNQSADRKSPLDLGDGFASEETHLTPSGRSQPWTPPGYYEDLSIKSLVPGPRPVLFTGRIVNLIKQLTPSKKPNAATGFMKLIVKDDTGAVEVSIALE